MRIQNKNYLVSNPGTNAYEGPNVGSRLEKIHVVKTQGAKGEDEQSGKMGKALSDSECHWCI